MVTRFVYATALLASLLVTARADAQDRTFRVDVPAGDLTDALATFAAQTGTSIGTDGTLRGRTSVAVRGRMEAGEALRRMLARSGMRAERVGPSIWRLVALRRDEVATKPRLPDPPAADIVVTGRKLSEALSRVAAPVSVFEPSDAGRPPGARADAHDVARAVEGLSLTNLGPGRDRPFIRGIADSPFNGFSQATVSVIVDDARVTYDAPEPGLRLVDVARVEVLKGPQGPLYGTGALGGVYRIVTNRPVLGAVDASATIGFDSVRGGGPGADATVMVNAPILGDTAAIRAVGYSAAQGGWVRNAGGRRDLNATSVEGARLTVRVAPAAGWTVDLGGALQRVSQRDSQYVDRDAEDLTRSMRIPEPSQGTFKLLSGTAEGSVGDARLTVSTSHAWQNRTETYAAAASASALGRADAQAYRDRRLHRVFDQEVRISSPPGRRVSWLAGASYLSATTLATGDLAGADRVYSPFFLLQREVTEAAVFADASAPLVSGLRLGGGGRLFRATTTDERREERGTPTTRAKASVVFTPSASLTYELAPDRLVYLRFGSAFRPGGLDPANARTGRYEADEVRSFDLGTRLLLADGRLSLSGGAFRSTWADVQSDYLQLNGLVATRTAGNAEIMGTELSVEWRPSSWRLRAGGAAQRARLESGVDGADLPKDRRLPVVPDLTGRLELGRTLDIAGIRSDLYVAADYVGRSRLSFDEGLDREMGGYATTRAGAAATIASLRIRIDVDNLLNARADRFAFGNPFMVRAEREYTPLRPRSIRLELSRRF
ncbi:TonB-dependent receptor [Sphingomonas sp. A2-49]|uniref:TonB-dependent receptor n=1 Tax=Sphingomonas sp. A2-49 TaxID=1391375 RepID=UPI0021D2B97C|nr:TonB-dependent receptor [Sphingomonas sp. A2-49]MCU6453406.1 TonB-dependent receptor [Sphingomonas sp. A2-49]